MTDSRTNIEFNYLYRDASNYKQFGSIIFSNPNNLSIDKVDAAIRNRLIDGEFFKHNLFNVPSLFFNTYNEDDHNLHEYENINITYEAPTDKRTIEEFLTHS